MGIEAILVLLLLIAPGLLADGLYRFLLWRPDPEDHVRFTRATFFSAGSLLLLLALADICEWISSPPYLSSEWWQTSWSGDFDSISSVALPWIEHMVLALLVALLASFIMRSETVSNAIRALAGQSLHRHAWAEFAAANHKQWVFVQLVDGRRYYGELGVVSGDREKGSCSVASISVFCH